MELMNKYAYSVYQEKSFTKSAEKLHISQPSLSAMIKKLESELGFFIFDRTKTPLSVTQKGEIYIQYLEECFENEKIMQQKLNSVSNFSTQTLSVGGGGSASRILFPKICKAFSKECSNVTVKMDMGGNVGGHNIIEKVENEINDIAISYTFDSERMIGVPLLEENFFLVMRRDFQGAEAFVPYSISFDDILASKRFDLKKLNYTIPYDMPILRTRRGYLSNVLDYANKFSISNYYVVNDPSVEILYDMMLEGLGAVIATDIMIAAKMKKNENVIFIPINTETNTRKSYIIYKKKVPLSDVARKFITIAQQICSDKSKLLAELSC